MVRANTPSSTRAWTWRFTDPPKRWMTATPPPVDRRDPGRVPRHAGAARSPGAAGGRHAGTGRGARPAHTESSAAHSRPTGGPGRRGRRGRRGAQHVRPCADRHNSDRTPAPCARTRRAGRSCSHRTGTGEPAGQKPHRGTSRTHTRRSAAARHRRSRADSARNVSNDPARPCTGLTRSGLAGCTRLGAHRHHRAGTVPTIRSKALRPRPVRASRRGVTGTHRPRRDGGIARVGALHSIARASGRRRVTCSAGPAVGGAAAARLSGAGL